MPHNRLGLMLGGGYHPKKSRTPLDRMIREGMQRSLERYYLPTRKFATRPIHLHIHVLGAHRLGDHVRKVFFSRLSARALVSMTDEASYWLGGMPTEALQRELQRQFPNPKHTKAMFDYGNVALWPTQWVIQNLAAPILHGVRIVIDAGSVALRLNGQRPYVQGRGEMTYAEHALIVYDMIRQLQRYASPTNDDRLDIEAMAPKIDQMTEEAEALTRRCNRWAFEDHWRSSEKRDNTLGERTLALAREDDVNVVRIVAGANDQPGVIRALRRRGFSGLWISNMVVSELHKKKPDLGRVRADIQALEEAVYGPIRGGR